jgi:hypothetical protein
MVTMSIEKQAASSSSSSSSSNDFSEFSYKNLTSTLSDEDKEITAKGYSASIGANTQDTPYKHLFFTIIRLPDITANQSVKPPKNPSYTMQISSCKPKIHISLDDSSSDNLEKGFNVVKEILMRYRVGYFKVIRPQFHLHDIKQGTEKIPLDAGKEITIYLECNPEILPTSTSSANLGMTWQQILTEITVGFEQQKVRPGYTPAGVNLLKLDPFYEYQIPGSCFFYYRYEKNTPKNDLFATIKIASTYQPTPKAPPKLNQASPPDQKNANVLEAETSDLEENHTNEIETPKKCCACCCKCSIM